MWPFGNSRTMPPTRASATLACLTACLVGCPGATAQVILVDSLQPGDHVSRPLKIGRRTISLPAGDWQLIVKTERNPSTDATRQMPTLVRLQFQELLDGRLNRMLELAASSYSARSDWQDEPCKYKGDSYWIEDRGTGTHDQFCLRVGFRSGMVDGARGDTFLAWARELKAKSIGYAPEMPAVTVTRYTTYDFLSMSISFDPAVSGIQRSKDSTRQFNDWNPTTIAQHPDHKGFYEALVSWTPVFAAAVQRAFDGDETLSPKDFAGPAFAKVR